MRIVLYYEDNRQGCYTNKKYHKYNEDEFRKFVDDICKEKGFDICEECAFDSSLEENIVLVDDNDCSVMSASSIASCQTLANGKFFCFYFRQELLDGKSRCIEEISDIILHELAHALADKRHQTNCEHDDRWIAVCKEIGYNKIYWGEGDSYNSVVNFKAKIIESSETSYLLRCAECNKIIVETPHFNNAMLNRFIFSGSSNLGFNGLLCTVNDVSLDAFTDCCSVRYMYEFDSDKLLEEIKKYRNNITEQFEEIVKQIVKNNL